MDKREAIRVIGTAFGALGLSGSGRRFRRAYDEILWLIDLELIPRTDRVGITVGVCPAQLAPEGLPTRANDCPVIFIPEGSTEPFGVDRARTWAALDMTADLDDETRADELRVVAESIVELTVQFRTVADLKTMASSGRLRGALRKDARALFFPEQ